MLIFALTIFTLVAIMGLGLALDVFKGVGSPVLFARIHALLALIGSALVIAAALAGDNRVWINIGLAVVIIGLGILISFRRQKGLPVKGLAALHGSLAVACYGLLGYIVIAG